MPADAGQYREKLDRGYFYFAGCAKQAHLGRSRGARGAELGQWVCPQVAPPSGMLVPT